MHDAASTSHDQPARSDAEQGQAAVEFALVLPVLALILFATIEFGTAFWHYQQLSAAASEGARKAAVSRSSGTRDADIVEAVRNASPGLEESQVNVAIASDWDPGDPVQVTVTYPENITIMGRVFYSANLTSRRTARVEH